MKLHRLLFACAIFTLLPLCHAQDDDTAGSKSTDSGSTTRSAKELQDEAIRSLMGDTEKPASTSGSKATSSSTKRSGSTTSATGSKTGTRSTTSDTSTPRRTGDTTTTTRPRPADSVPSVPSVPESSTGSGFTAPVTPAPDATMTPDTAPPLPATNMTMPVTPGVDTTTTAPTTPYTQTPLDATALSQNAAMNQMGEEMPPERNTGSTIIIGLIILAVLLVGLATVVGIMAANRSRPVPPHQAGMRGTATAPVIGSSGEPVVTPFSGWAYLAAEGAPDINLHRTPFVMGSAQQSDLILADPKASPEHARIERTQDGYVLMDLNSLNGTYLNGERIASPVILRAGDAIQMGDIHVKFEVYENI